MSKVKPILFNTDMVRAILEGRKTVTRRVVKPQPEPTESYCANKNTWRHKYTSYALMADCDVKRECAKAVPYQPGDILYVRETWTKLPVTPGGHLRPNGVYYYKSDEELRPERFVRNGWHPSIHMPKEAARLFLRVKDVRVERLQDIDNTGARAEGCDGRCECPSSGAPGSLSCVTRDFSIERFQTVWDSTIKPADLPVYGWEANPWIWVIDFERVEKNYYHNQSAREEICADCKYFDDGVCDFPVRLNHDSCSCFEQR